MLRLIFCFSFYSATFGLGRVAQAIACGDGSTRLQESAQPQRAAAQERARGRRAQRRRGGLVHLDEPDRLPEDRRRFRKESSLCQDQNQPLVAIFDHAEDRNRSARRALCRRFGRLVAAWRCGSSSRAVSPTPYLSPELKAFPAGSFDPAGLLVVDGSHAHRARLEYQIGRPGRRAQELSGSAEPQVARQDEFWQR